MWKEPTSAKRYGVAGVYPYEQRDMEMERSWWLNLRKYQNDSRWSIRNDETKVFASCAVWDACCLMAERTAGSEHSGSSAVERTSLRKMLITTP